MVDFEHDGALHPPRTLPDEDAKSFVWAAHHYDVVTLVSKKFRTWIGLDLTASSTSQWVTWGSLPYFGHSGVVRAMATAFKHVHSLAADIGSRGVPTLIGETGVPFDLGPNKWGYRTGDLSLETVALDSNLQALDMNLASFTLWCYTPDNSNKRGDNWNDEDLSVFSEDQRGDPTDLYSGGRGLMALVRPYAFRTAGVPIRMTFAMTRPDRRFTFVFEESVTTTTTATTTTTTTATTTATAAAPTIIPTVIFVPQYQYVREDELEVTVSDGSFTLDWPNQTLHYTHDPNTPPGRGGRPARHSVTLRRIQPKAVRGGPGAGRAASLSGGGGGGRGSGGSRGSRRMDDPLGSEAGGGAGAAAAEDERERTESAVNVSNSSRVSEVI